MLLSEGVGRVGVECGNQCRAEVETEVYGSLCSQGLEIDETDETGYEKPEKLRNRAKKKR